MWWIITFVYPGPNPNIHASVVGPMNRAQFVQRYGNPPAVSGNGFPTKLQAAAAAAKYNNENHQTGSTVNDPSVFPNIKSPLTNPLSGVNAIGDFFNRLTQPNTWVRVGEVVAGVLLLYLGLSATMRGTEAGKQLNKAKGLAKTAAGVAIK